jgi:hypothetical protein
MNEHLRDRILRKVEALSDDRGYQVLDYVEFLESRYAERQSPYCEHVYPFYRRDRGQAARGQSIREHLSPETVSFMNRAANVSEQRRRDWKRTWRTSW